MYLQMYTIQSLIHTSTSFNLWRHIVTDHQPDVRLPTARPGSLFISWTISAPSFRITHFGSICDSPSGSRVTVWYALSTCTVDTVSKSHQLLAYVTVTSTWMELGDVWWLNKAVSKFLPKVCSKYLTIVGTNVLDVRSTVTVVVVLASVTATVFWNTTWFVSQL